MPRWIDAEKCPCNHCHITYCRANCKDYYEWFDNGENVEVAERAYWAVELGKVTCSNCGTEPSYEKWFNGKYYYPDYCHECGRRMNAVSRKAQKEGETDA